MFAARENDIESARLLVKAGADVNAVGGDGKDALALALFNGSYEVASFLIDSHANVNQADAQRFTPLFWAVDRRNMETAPNFPWMVTTDPLPLIKKLLDAGADPNAVINSTPRARMREGSPRIVFATALMRAAFAGDIELVKLLLAHGADPHIISSDRETTLMAACGTGFINGYHRQRTPAERLEVVKLLIDLGEDVNAADNYGITPLMVAANLGDVAIVQYLIDKGADLGAHDLGKKNDGAFGSSIEPLMPIDYAIGVGTFVPNNAVIMHADVVKLMSERDEAARNQTHHLRMHLERIHLRFGQRRSQDRHARGDRQDQKDPDRIPGGRNHGRPGGEGTEIRIQNRRRSTRRVDRSKLPDVYYVTDYYVNYQTVPVRMSRIHPDPLRDLLRMAWQFVSGETKTSETAIRKRRAIPRAPR